MANDDQKFSLAASELTAEILSLFGGKNNMVVSAALMMVLAIYMSREGKAMAPLIALMDGGEDGGEQPTTQ